jgi:hypothetical protein
MCRTYADLYPSVLHTSCVLRIFVCDTSCLSNIRTITCSTCEYVNRTVHILTTLLVIFCFVKSYMPVPVAAWTKALVCGRSLSEIVCSNPAGARISVCCECCVLSCRGLWEELIIRPESSYRLWCVMCDLKTS